MISRVLSAIQGSNQMFHALSCAFSFKRPTGKPQRNQLTSHVLHSFHGKEYARLMNIKVIGKGRLVEGLSSGCRLDDSVG